ncbi:DUF2922 domain-containing protein [Liquorilactobacillus capillatus]|uniref:DUF2922 domain-containing protein n=1 Tax=Liquorilactobacillus capillatus DSM 19910 TaxID=1423731 RepID=A0A0R1M923_9LACO|nr:DUF2922 domain-containing protein [Liquorilactobacillus capillatus]KRL00563.1 hypothetical protein FC81_GL001919 [Liquorilactobacillus capillatus DSM 19910]
MKQLDLVFAGQTGQIKHHLRLNYINNSLDKETVLKAMQDITELGIFIDKKGEKLYDRPLSAQYVDKQETPIITA